MVFQLKIKNNSSPQPKVPKVEEIKSVFSYKLGNPEFSFKNYLVKIIKDPDPILDFAKKLRYDSFFKNKKDITNDSDEFDKFCDHLVVIDTAISPNFVVGTYRLLLKKQREKYKRFYSESEFDLSNFFNIKNISMLEAGRSCVHEDYRDGRIIKLLWKGLASYIISNKVDLIFGCASFPSSNHLKFNNQLSYLYHYHKPPKKYISNPIENLRAEFEISPLKDICIEEEFRSLPPLIKAYIRAGAWVNPGVVIDKKFNTTDVLIILKSENIIKKYSKLSVKE